METVEKLEAIYKHLVPSFKVSSTEKSYIWLHSCLKPLLDRGMHHLGLDGRYFVPSRAETEQIINWDWIDKKKYIKEKFDCSNFSISFKAHCDRVFLVNHVGIVIDYSSGHGYNCFVDPEQELWLFEPQTDRYWNIKDHDFNPPYKLESGYIMI